MEKNGGTLKFSYKTECSSMYFYTNIIYVYFTKFLPLDKPIV
jgi:hypothetical protein